MSSTHHIQTWLDALTDHLLPRVQFPFSVERFADRTLETIFTWLGLISSKTDFTHADIALRSTCFIEEFKQRGGSVSVLHGPAGYTNHFRVHINGKTIRFESLPVASFASKYSSSLVDDKNKTKLHLQNGNFPIAQGRSFWFWQKQNAVTYGATTLGFPLVVKPRGGSVSRHVTTNIQDSGSLKAAIQKAISYSPTFIVETFIPHAFVYRATVIDFNFVACVKQVPAHIIGDGVSTIRELIDTTNNDPRRGEPDQNEYTLYHIVENETSTALLHKQGYTVASVPHNNEVIFLQNDPFLKLGGDLVEVTSQVHPDNLKLFRDIARFFDIRVVGIDFLAHDITQSYTQQPCAVLELNSAPCIELHHFPSSGTPQNVASALTDLFFKYYL